MNGLVCQNEMSMLPEIVTDLRDAVKGGGNLVGRDGPYGDAIRNCDCSNKRSPVGERRGGLPMNGDPPLAVKGDVTTHGDGA